MADKAKDRLAKILEDLNKRGGGPKDILQVPETPIKVRMVPYPHDEDKMPFIQAEFHYSIGGHRSLSCPQNFGDPCPICELADKVKSQGTKEGYEIFKKLRSKTRVYSPVIIRGREDEGIKLWAYGITVYKDLVSKEYDEDWGSLYKDVEDSHDISLIKIPKGKGGNTSNYDMVEHEVKPMKTSLLNDNLTKKKLLEMIKAMPDYLNEHDVFKTKTYDELVEIVSKMSSDDEDDEDDKETSWAKTTSDDESEDDDILGSTTKKTQKADPVKSAKRDLSALDEYLKDD